MSEALKDKNFHWLEIRISRLFKLFHPIVFIDSIFQPTNKPKKIVSLIDPKGYKVKPV